MQYVYIHTRPYFNRPGFEAGSCILDEQWQQQEESKAWERGYIANVVELDRAAQFSVSYVLLELFIIDIIIL